MRIAILTTDHPNHSSEVEITANSLTENGRHVLKGLLDRLREELDELDYQEREEEERES